MEDPTDFKQLFLQAEQAYVEAMKAGMALGEAIVNALKSIIPDLIVDLGGYESGIEAITFDSDSHELKLSLPSNWHFLSDIIENIIKPKNFYFEGFVVLSPKEEVEVRKIIAKLVGEKEE